MAKVLKRPRPICVCVDYPQDAGVHVHEILALRPMTLVRSPWRCDYCGCCSVRYWCCLTDLCMWTTMSRWARVGMFVLWPLTLGFLWMLLCPRYWCQCGQFVPVDCPWRLDADGHDILCLGPSTSLCMLLVVIHPLQGPRWIGQLSSFWGHQGLKGCDQNHFLYTW